MSFGCNSDPNREPPNHVVDTLPPGDYAKIQVIDSLQPWIWCGSAIETKATGGDPMLIEVPVRNVSDYELNVQYAFQYFDANHRQLNDQETWRNQTLSPRIEYRFKGTAADARTVDWRMIVRVPRT